MQQRATEPATSTPAGRPPARRHGLAARAGRWLKAWSWLNLRLASSTQEWLRRHFTPAGQGVLAATLAAGLFGLDTRLTAAHQVFAFGLALLAIAWLGTRAPMPPLALRRRAPSRAAAGQPCRYRVEVQHAGRRPARGLTLHERLPDPRPGLATFLDRRAPVEATLNPFERLLGYPRWEWLLQQARRAEAAPPAALPLLSPGSSAVLELTLTPTRRGWLSLDALVLGREDPLGLMRRERRVAGEARCLVLPVRHPVPALRPPGRRRLQPGGVEQASRVGDSQEFMGLRDYLPGDSPRHIHWAAWARCGEPVVKEYRDEFFSRQALVLDTCPAAGDDPGRFEAAVSAAASLIAPLGERPNGPDGLLDLVLCADGPRILTAGRGLMSTAAMLEVLACVAPQPPAAFAALAETLTVRATRQSACLCVLLGWDAERRALVEQLRRVGLPVTVVVVDGADEPEPDDGEVIGLDVRDLASGLGRLSLG
ncbi:DUF58 domain-containing protein [uncultured Thiohalocapsa sp.]|uniref:DUF58 domain-containing protein n=1 Tax=uncultured Thiohalocapsa sp. TaxID=768990 RepID=UPI0025CE521B|nr:DUF58 domain-containing protein [uncultured Thiohalocapsa sp.]